MRMRALIGTCCALLLAPAATADFVDDPVFANPRSLGFNLAVDQDCDLSRDRVANAVAGQIDRAGVRPVDVYVDGPSANPNPGYHLQIRAECWINQDIRYIFVESYWVIQTDEWGFLKTYPITDTIGEAADDWYLMERIEEVSRLAMEDFREANPQRRRGK